MAKVLSEDALRVILNFLHTHSFHQSLLALEQESGVHLHVYGKELDFFYDLVCQGRFDDAEKFIEPLKKRSAGSFKHVLYCLRQQKFLETVENEASPDVNELSQQLQELEEVGTKEQIMVLCAVLQLNKITEHADFEGWTVWSGRLNCFNDCLKSLKEVYSIEEQFTVKETLTDLMAKREPPVVPEIKSKKSESEGSFVVNESEGSERGNSASKKTVSWNTQREKVVINTPPAPVIEQDEKKVFIEALDIEEASEQASYQEDEEKDPVRPTARSTHELMAGFTPTALREVSRVQDCQPIRAATFNASGDYFVLGTNSKSIKICSTQNIVDGLLYNEQQGRQQYIDVVFEVRNAHYGSVYCVDWSRNKNIIASGSNDKSIRIVNCPDLLSLQETQSETVVYSNGNYLVGEGDLPEIQERVLAGSQGTVRTVCFHPEEDSILLSGGMVDPDIKVWNVETGQCVQNLKGNEGAVYRITASGDASYFTSVGFDKKVRLWDIRSNRCSMALNGSSFVEMSYVSLNHSAVQTRVETKSKIAQLYMTRMNQRPSQSFSSQKLAAVAHCDGMVTFWDLTASRLFSKLNYHKSECRSVEFSSDTRWLVSASFDTTLGLVDMHRGQTYRLEQHADRVVSATWHPYLPIVLSTSADKTARLFST